MPFGQRTPEQVVHHTYCPEATRRPDWVTHLDSECNCAQSCAYCGEHREDHITTPRSNSRICPEDWCWDCESERDTCHCADYQPDGGYYGPDPYHTDYGLIKPETTDALRFGVEIEISSHEVSDTAELLTDNGINTGPGERNRDWWRVVYDGSIYNGAEVVSPILDPTNDGMIQLREVMNILQDNGCTAGTSCGVHVHFDAAPLGAQWAADYVTAYTASQKAINAMLTPSRRGNDYCAPWSKYDLSTLYHLRQGRHPGVTRYKTVNVDALFKHGTVEARQHGGTVIYDKIRAWINLQRALILGSPTLAEEGAIFDNHLSLLTHLSEEHRLDDTTATYLDKRATAIAARHN